MKRMAGSSTAADNKPAVALGRDMLKRPSQRNMTVASAGGDGPMGASVSMSAFSSSVTSSSRRPPRSERFKKPTLNGSFTAFLQNNPKEEVERLTNHIMAAVAKQNQKSDTNKNNNKDNETFSPIQQRRRPTNRRRSNSITNADLPMNWDGYYKPASSRRNSSKEGGELVQSMKLNAAKLLAELGDIADDSDEDDLQLDFPDTCGEVSYEPVQWDR